jgi:hypothetical protein
LIVITLAFVPQDTRWNIVGDLWGYPFNAMVWGSLSDWCMVFVTAVTAYFLYKTLTAQLLLTKLEIDKYQVLSAPKFEFIRYEDNSTLAEEDRGFHKGNISVASPSLFHLYDCEMNVTSKYHGVEKKWTPQKAAKLPQWLRLTVLFEIQMQPGDNNVSISITATFKDKIGNKYMQEFWYSLQRQERVEAGTGRIYHSLRHVNGGENPPQIVQYAID